MLPSFPTTARDFHTFFAARGWRPSRRLGQNFLLGTEAHERIARFAEVDSSDRVVEIGCGLGSLTRILASRAGFVRATDVDRRLLAACQEFFPPGEGLAYWLGDCIEGKRAFAGEFREVLDRDRARFPGCSREKWVANLPYSVSGPLLALLFSTDRAPARVTVTVQREMAERVLAQPGSEAYGPLAVLASLASRGRVRAALPRSAFWPQPNVDSCVLDLVLREDRPIGIRRLAAFLPELFAHRRKTLASALAGSGTLHRTATEIAAVLAGLGFDPRERAERMEPSAILHLMSLLERELGLRYGE